MRRAATSVPSNFVEGAARGKNKFAQFIRVAVGSISELDTHLEIALRLGYLSQDMYEQLDNELAEIDRMLIVLRKSLIA